MIITEVEACHPIEAIKWERQLGYRTQPSYAVNFGLLQGLIFRIFGPKRDKSHQIVEFDNATPVRSRKIVIFSKDSKGNYYCPRRTAIDTCGVYGMPCIPQAKIGLVQSGELAVK